MQSVVDDKNGLIIQADATDSPTDHKQLSKQINYAQEIIGKKCDVACADAGYSDVDDLKELDDQGIHVVVPNQAQASDKEPKPFSKKEFIYDETRDQYQCPEGHSLRKSSYNKRKNQYSYRITSKKLCKGCRHYGQCTTDRKGRTIKRLVNEKLRNKLAAQYETPEDQEIYTRRKTRAEHPFGHIKNNLGIKNFLLRGTEGAQAEVSVTSTCFNIARMITLLGGVPSLVAKLVALKG